MQKLSVQEYTALTHLAHGMTYALARKAMCVSLSHFHVIVHHIRQKTGIKCTSDVVECRKMLQRIPKPLDPRDRATKPPTRSQMECMRLRGAGYSYGQIADVLSITVQTAKNQVSEGCKRAKLPRTWNRKAAIREYMANYADLPQNPPTMDDPAFN